MKYKLGDIANFQYGRMPDKADYLKSVGYPIFSGYKIVGHADTFMFAEPEVIVVARGVGGTGDVKMSPPKCFLTNLSIAVLIDEAVALKKYIYYMFQINNLRYLDSGSAQSQITIGDLKNIEIDVPDIPAQQHIVNLLGSLDEKIENNERMVEKLNQCLAKIFKQNVINAPHTFIKLSELCSQITKGTTPTTLGKNFTESGIRFIKAESILNNRVIDDSKTVYIDEATNEILKRSQIKAGDILFTIAGTIGRFTMADARHLPANTNQAVAIIRVEKIRPSYVYATLLSGFLDEQIFSKTVQAVQANFSLSMIGNLPIPIIPEIKILCEEFDTICAKIQSIINEIAKLQELRKLYLKKFFS